MKTWLPEKAVEKIKFVSRKDIKTYVPLDQALKCWGGDNPYTFNFVPLKTPEEEKTAPTVSASNKKVSPSKCSHMSDLTFRTFKRKLIQNYGTYPDILRY